MVGKTKFFLSLIKEKSLFIFTGKTDLPTEEILQGIKKLFPSIKSFCMMDQIHGTKITWISKAPENTIEIVKDSDGLVTTLPGVALVVRTADCLPLLFSKPDGSVRGALHCGWRGLEGSIIQKALTEMELNGFPPEDMLFVAGPSICGNCYRVGEEFKRLSLGRFLKAGNNGLYLSLKKVAKERLSERGALEENIKLIPFCTYENPSIFFSHRRGDRGRQLSIVANL